MSSKTLRAQRANIITEARALISKENATAEDHAAFDAAMGEADKLKATIDRVERADELAAQVAEANFRAGIESGRSSDEVAEEKAGQERAFANFLRVGMSNLSAEDRIIAQRRFGPVQNAQGEGTASSGGYTVPTGFYDVLTDAQKAFGGMLNAATIIDTSTGASLPMPTANDTNNEGAILAENTQVSTQDVTFGQTSLNAWTYTSKLVLVSNQLLQDSAFNLSDWLAMKLGTRLARATNRHFTVGTGSGQPTGIVTGALATNGGAAQAVGATGETTSIIYDDLVNLEHSVDPAYRPNGQFMFSDAVLKILKKLKDGYGRPLWLSGIAVKEPDTINGYPYMINQHMPVPAANASSMIFGDLKSYMIRRVAGTQVLRLTERYADYNQTGFLAFQRWDGTLLDAGTHPVAVWQNSAT